jgi:hypothetical protein
LGSEGRSEEEAIDGPGSNPGRESPWQTSFFGGTFAAGRQRGGFCGSEAKLRNEPDFDCKI